MNRPGTNLKYYNRCGLWAYIFIQYGFSHSTQQQQDTNMILHIMHHTTIYQLKECNRKSNKSQVVFLQNTRCVYNHSKILNPSP
ncbi:hypothetical protein Hanom_Chr15g01377451 [Helianthus anomalus]